MEKGSEVDRNGLRALGAAGLMPGHRITQGISGKVSLLALVSSRLSEGSREDP